MENLKKELKEKYLKDQTCLGIFIDFYLQNGVVK